MESWSWNQAAVLVDDYFVQHIRSTCLKQIWNLLGDKTVHRVGSLLQEVKTIQTVSSWGQEMFTGSK